MHHLRKMERTARRRSKTEKVESLTIHGWSRISATKSKFGKAIWVAFCLVASGLLVYFVAISILKHFRHEVTLKVDRKQHMDMAFPAITFCNTNFYSQYSTYYYSTGPVYQDLPKNCSMDDLRFFKNKVNQEFFKIGCKMFFGNKTVYTSLHDTGFFGDFKFPEHFTLLPHSYPCFTLNNNSALKQLLVDSASGVHLLLDFDENERIHGDPSEEKQYRISPFSDTRNGLYVAVHSPKDFHGFEGIPLSPGFETRISFSKSLIQRKKSPFPSKCLDDNEQRFTNIFPGRPNMASCWQSCFYLNIYQLCASVPSYMRPFMPFDQFPDQSFNGTCPIEVYYDPALLQNCQCRLPCYEERYKTNVMQRVWPQGWQTGQFEGLFEESLSSEQNHTLTINDVRKRLIKVSLYYSELAEYFYEEREVYEYTSVLSDIGGQVGLFIGASIISLIEVLWLLSMLAQRLFKPKEKVEDSVV